MMRGLLVTEIFPPQTGGSGRWYWEIYRRMPRDAFQIVAGEHPGSEAIDKPYEQNVVRLPLAMNGWGIRSLSGLRGYVRSVRALRKIIRRQQIDVIHTGRCLPEGWIAWILNRIYGVPYYVFVHGEDIGCAATSGEHRWMVNRVFRRAECLIANSNNTARLLLEEWNVPRSKVQVLHPGADMERFVPADDDPQKRAQLGWSGRKVVLTVGRLQERKGHDQLIRALPHVREKVPNVLYAIVGEGEQRESLERLVGSLGLQDHVQFLGEMGDDRLVDCYQQSDLFVLPNRTIGGDIEGFGMVLVEAQACGTPVLAGDSGGTADTMDVGRTGFIVDCNSHEPLAEKITSLLQDDALRSEMGKAGRSWVTQRFSWPALAAEARAVFGIEESGDTSSLEPLDGNEPNERQKQEPQALKIEK